MLGPAQTGMTPMTSDKSGRPPRMSMGCAPMSTRKHKAQPRSSSNITNGGGSSRVTDPRNVGEKQFMNTSIRQLIEFLSRNNYEGPLSPKILSKPTNKDFSNIVLFLFTLIDPNYKCTGKFEDEMITMFRFLGYPFSIAKSNITAVGSPHAWPVLLAAIMWLVELLKYDEAASKASVNASMRLMGEDDSADLADGNCKASAAAQLTEQDPSLSERAFYNYLGRAYGLFLSGKDDQYANLEEQFVGSFENKNVLIKDQMEALETRNQALSNEIEDVRSRSALLPQLQDKKREFQQSHAQFQQLMQELCRHRDQLRDKQQQRAKELEQLLVSVAAAQKEVAVLRDKVSHQELSPEDVVNMVGEKDRLQEAQQQASEQRQGLQKRVWELEMALRDKVKALEDAARMYHGVAEQLKLVPVTARNARGEDLSVDVDVRAKKKEGLLRTDVRHHVLPILQQIRSELNSSTFELRSELMTESEVMEEVAANQAELKDRCDELQARCRRAEATYKREKDMLDQSAELHAKELDAMEARLALLRDTAAEEGRVTAAKRRFAEATALRAARKAEHERKKHAMIQAVMQVVSQAAAHRESVQQQISQLKDRYAARLHYFLGSASNITTAGALHGAVGKMVGAAGGFAARGSSDFPSDTSYYRAMSEQLLNTSTVNIENLPLGSRLLMQQRSAGEVELEASSPHLGTDGSKLQPQSDRSQQKVPGSSVSARSSSARSAKSSGSHSQNRSAGKAAAASASDEKSLRYHDIYPNDSMFEDEPEHQQPKDALLPTVPEPVAANSISRALNNFFDDCAAWSCEQPL